MLFNSLTFAAFLPIAFAIYWWLGRLKQGVRWQNMFLIVSGYIFYGWWDWRFLGLLFTATIVDFLVGRKISTYPASKSPFWLLGISLTANLGILGFFKYFDFFSTELSQLIGLMGLNANLPLLKVLLPVGISFYTFQTLSYTIDVYRGKLQATNDPIEFFAFVSFFPPLLAGPIERATHLLPQIQKRRVFDYAFAVTGLRLILWGIFKKVVIADTLAPYVEFVFGETSPGTSLEVLMATIFFVVQLYCDFSGYTDVARGSARLLGFELAPNFDRPFFAASLQEFWKRWHISLSSWFQDYLYFPLGGNRKGKLRNAWNLLLTFLLSGLWHGAALTFVIWGGINGLWLLIERNFKLSKRLPRWLMHVLTIGVILFGFIWFRAGSIANATRLVSGLFSFHFPKNLFVGIEADISQSWPLATVLCYLFGMIGFLLLHDGIFNLSLLGGRFASLPRWTRWLYYYSLIAWLLALGAYGKPQQFIYFQF